MAWLVLIIAGLIEVAFVMALGHSGSFRRFWPTTAVFVFGLLSLYLLALAMRGVPVGTAFAVWAALGAGGAVVLGILLRGEPAKPLRLASLATVICGAVMLRLVEG